MSEDRQDALDRSIPIRASYESLVKAFQDATANVSITGPWNFPDGDKPVVMIECMTVEEADRLRLVVDCLTYGPQPQPLQESQPEHD